ncbi:dipeptidase [Sphingosinicella rhizophila]|uniref:Membrane dipeptidase n=1 Tax=Sphingosinicella rhizophila TaxID=3050082 RepID=A0ABU3Q9X6_9SPHN|nr:membrane dipeptidase [Sphingosinicella sp. GR2756]MDT9600215.1 membrane dipeptidase [Sphingosinicella sp. GR2756]
MTNDERPSGFDSVSRRQFIAAAAIGAAVPAVAASKAIEQGPASAPRRLVVSALDTSALNENYISLLKTGGVDCMNLSFDGFENSYRFAYEFRDQIVLAKSVSEIRQAQAAGKIAAFFNSQVADAFETALFEGNFPLGSFKQMAAKVRASKSLGLGVQGLCYNVYNVFGSGCLDDEVPLSRAGKRLVEELHKNQIVLDVGGHTGERTSLDAIEASSGVPIVCSHTNFRALNDNARAISDRLASAIASTGGVIGITAVSAFHTRNRGNVGEAPRQATLDEHLDQYDHAKRIVGVDHVGLGPDFILGAADTFDMDPDDSAAFPTWSMGPGIQSTVKDFEDISKLPNVISGLKRRGWTESELDKLLGANWLRVYQQVWGS